MNDPQANDLLEIATTLSQASRLLYEFGLKYPETPRVMETRLGVVQSSVNLARSQLGILVRDDLEQVLTVVPSRD